jgi:hypothetical protein
MLLLPLCSSLLRPGHLLRIDNLHADAPTSGAKGKIGRVTIIPSFFPLSCRECAAEHHLDGRRRHALPLFHKGKQHKLSVAQPL